MSIKLRVDVYIAILMAHPLYQAQHLVGNGTQVDFVIAGAAEMGDVSAAVAVQDGDR